MKTTKAQQEETRARIVRAATALIVAHGYEQVTMKDIAQAAGVGDATIYKYFASKDRLIVGYFDLLAEQAVRTAASTPGFSEFDLQSRLQRLTDALLEAMTPDRAFVELARDMLSKSPLLLLGDQLKAKAILKEAVAAYLSEAVQAGEIAPSDYIRAMSGLYIDFFYGVIAFWLSDETEHAGETTRLVDQLLGVLVTMLKAGLPDRLVQLAGFVVRSQMARILDASAVLKRPAGAGSSDAAPAASADRKVAGKGAGKRRSAAGVDKTPRGKRVP
jgi:TetR/AcrR family transcriptional regulator, regulator of autoinduction and epiphytic fitness